MLRLVTIIGLSSVLASTGALASGDNSAGKRQSDASQPKYCITFAPSTGSHVNKTECRTKSEWKDLGIDVDELRHK